MNKIADILGTEKAQTYIRAVLKFGGGYLVASGKVTDSTWQEIIGLVMGFIGLAWGHTAASTAQDNRLGGPTAGGPTSFPSILFVFGLLGFFLGASGCLNRSTEKSAIAGLATESSQVRNEMRMWFVYILNHPVADTNEVKVHAAYDKYLQAKGKLKGVVQAWKGGANGAGIPADVSAAQTEFDAAEAALIAEIHNQEK